MFVLLRAIIYASGFIAALLIFIPARLLERAGISRPASWGLQELLGLGVVVGGSLLAVWCILTFVFVGRGTPAPFDPPRRLVVRGPYQFVRNPMYIGAGLALAGAALVFHSLALVGYLALLAVVIQCLVVWYEEPTLGRLFGPDYVDYRREVHRWLPKLPKEERPDA